MGFFDKIKAFFDTGGIKVKLEAPNGFAWEQRHINVVVTLTGNKNETKTIDALDFSLKSSPEPQEQQRQQQGQRNRNNSTPSHEPTVTYDWSRPGPIELAAGEVRDVPVKVLLPRPVGPDQGDAPSVSSQHWARMQSHDRWTLAVSAKVEGARFSRGASRQLRVTGAAMGAFNVLRNLRSEVDDFMTEAEDEKDASSPY